MNDVLPGLTAAESAWVYKELAIAKKSEDKDKNELKEVELNELEKVVLRGLMAGKSFSAIADEAGYSEDYLREIATKKLYRYVEKWIEPEIETKITKQTIRPTIEEQVKLKDIQNPPSFYGREGELGTLQQWIISNQKKQKNVSLIMFCGFVKIGKTALVAKLIRGKYFHTIFNRFIWISLEYCPTLEQLISDLKNFLPESALTIFQDTEDPIKALIYLLSNFSYCLVLDGVREVLFYDVDKWKRYTELFTRLVKETFSSKSIVIITSRIRLRDLEELKYQYDNSIYSYTVDELDFTACEALLQEHKLEDKQCWKDLISPCPGHPGYINMIAEEVRRATHGRVARFLSQNTIYTTEYEETLKPVFSYLDSTDRLLLKILAEASTPFYTEEFIEKVYPKVVDKGIRRSDIRKSIFKLEDRFLVKRMNNRKSREVYIIIDVNRAYIDRHFHYSLS